MQFLFVILVAALSCSSLVWGDPTEKKAKQQQKQKWIHVLHTDLIHTDSPQLQQAQLNVLRTLAVPRLSNQQNGDFLWIIWVDPNFTEDFKFSLKDAVEHMPNAIVLAHCRNATINFRDSNGLNPRHVNKVHVSGDKQVLKKFHMGARRNLLLETTMNHHDFIHDDFIESIQRQARLFFSSGQESSREEDKVHCPNHSTQWHLLNKTQGVLEPLWDDTFCAKTRPKAQRHRLDLARREREHRHLQHNNKANKGTSTKHHKETDAKMSRWYETCIHADFSGIQINQIEDTQYIHHYCVEHYPLSRMLEAHESNDGDFNKWYEECIAKGYSGVRVHKVVGGKLEYFCVSRLNQDADGGGGQDGGDSDTTTNPTSTRRATLIENLDSMYGIV